MPLRVKDVKKKVAGTFRAAKAKVLGRSGTANISEPPVFNNPLYVDPSTPEGGANVEGKEIPAGLALGGAQITETADETAIRLAKRKQTAFYQLRNVQKTKWLVGGGVAVFLLLLIIIIASTTSKNKEDNPWDAQPSTWSWESCGPSADSLLSAGVAAGVHGAGYPANVAYGQGTALPQSSPNQLMVLDFITLDCKATTIARSYDGHNWEGVLPTPLQPSCGKGSGACFMDIYPEQAGQYRVDMYDRTTNGRAPTALQFALRLLGHGTFGANKNDISDWLTTFGNRTKDNGKDGSNRKDGGRVRGRYARGSHSATSMLDEAEKARLSSLLLNTIQRGNQTVVNDDVMTEAAREWFDAEVAKPTTSLREYFRQRTSDRISSPQPQGSSYGICDVGSRWNRYTLQSSDKGRYLTVTTNVKTSRWTIKVDGNLRGETNEFNGKPWGLNAESAGGVLCTIEEKVGGSIQLRDQSDNENAADFDANIACRVITLTLKNPILQLPSNQDMQTFNGVDFELGQIRSSHNDSFYLKRMGDPSCNELTKSSDQKSFVMITRSGGVKEYYSWDQRLKSVGNTVMEPAEIEDWSGGQCPMATKSFLNARGCRRQQTDACAPQVYNGATVVPLSETMMKLWYTFNTRYIYRVEGLRFEDKWAAHTPCNDGLTTRWIKYKAGACARGTETKIDGGTKITIETAFRESTDEHPTIKDLIVTGKGGVCDNDPNVTQGMTITINRNACWQHVHPDEHNVYDFTRWSRDHPGNQDAAAAGRPNPIMQFASSETTEDKQFDLVFPSWHGMDRWAKYAVATRYGVHLMGKHGEYVSFANLHTEVQTEEVANFLNASTVAIDGGLFEACGSPGEVGNDMQWGNRYRGHCVYFGGCSDTADYAVEPGWGHARIDGKNMLWQNMAFKADDQFRHRVAWALSQIFVLAEGSLDFEKYTIEPFAMYYDIFVRHAFGSYRDMLREVSASPMMGVYLTFKGNREAEGGRLPDENYAREIMQLFSVGLFELNMDGTNKKGKDGADSIDTYSNEDIATFARAWTGFDFSPRRGNHDGSGPFGNRIDPMQLKSGLRDQFPKTKLRDGYLGDGFPLCSELPSSHFLLKGTVYQYTGNVSAFGKFHDEDVASGKPGATTLFSHFTPEPGVSALHNKLCIPENGGLTCTFPVEVILDQNLECSNEVECGAADDVKVVKILSSDGSVGFYTHIPARCVRMSFFENGQLNGVYEKNHQCADPTLTATTGNACCNTTTGKQMSPAHLLPTTTATSTTGTSTTLTSITTSVDTNSTTTTTTLSTTTTQTTVYTEPVAQCLFVGETMTYKRAQQRCTAAYGVDVGVCSAKAPFTRHSTNYACARGQNSWYNDSCHLQLEVHPNGDVSILEPHAALFNRRLAQSTGIKFRVRWNTKPGQTVSDVIFPLADKGCDIGCHAVVHTCVCDVTVVTSVLYSGVLPSKPDMLKALTIGAYNPTDYGPGVYRLCSAPQCTSNSAVKVYTKNGGNVDSSTIFEFVDHEVPISGGGRLQKYWLNRISNVNIGREYDASVDTYEVASGVGQAGGICTCPSGEEYEVGEIGVGCEQLACVGGVSGSCNATGIASENWHKKVVCAGSSEATKSRKGFSFRNPPGFNPFMGQEIQDGWRVGGPYHAKSSWDGPHAEHETDALLDHLFEHENTPPFVALHMIKRFVTSNPSPRYVESVATAFVEGAYDGTTYSGTRGDMHAAMAALFLDSEARASILDADPTHGKFQEPLLKVIKMMRALEFTQIDDREVHLYNMDTVVGQDAFASPSVFNFYLAEYSPPGALGDLALVAPESQILTAPTIITYFNLMSSLIQNGFKYGNFGSRERGTAVQGTFKFEPMTPEHPESVVDELSMLLTEGRLDNDNHDIISEEYANYPEDLRFAYSTGTSAYTGAIDIEGTTTSSRGVKVVGGDTSIADSLKAEDDVSRVVLSANQSSVNTTDMVAVAGGWTSNTNAASALADETKSGAGGKPQQCAVTNDEANPWWEVDLGAVKRVRSLVIITSPLALESFADFDVYLDGVKCTPERNATAAEVSMVSSVNTAPQQTRSWNLMKRVSCVGTGQVVRIQLNTDDGASMPLVLCTVQVETAFKTNALKHAQKLFLASSETHATNLNRAKLDDKPPKPPQTSLSRPYKAVVLLFLNGGCDSYSLVVPHSKCKDIVDPTSETGKKIPFDLYQEYAEVRGAVVALPKDDLLQIDVPKENNQPCDTFGVHPSLPFIHELYKNGSATFLANVGTLVEPITKEELLQRGGPAKRVPKALYSHNGQMKVTSTVDSANMAAQGILGRMANELTQQEMPYKSALYSMVGTQKVLEGGGIVSPDIIGSNGIARFTEYSSVYHCATPSDPRCLKRGFDKLLNKDSASLFSQTISDVMQSTLDKTEYLGALAKNVTSTSNYTVDRTSSLSKQFDLVSKMMKLDTTKLGNERAAYVVSRGGFDTHSTPDLSPLFEDINAGLEQFVNELKAQDLWDNVTIMCVSDFGRTITSNSQGTDHSWGGNYWILGGGLKGGQMLGKYPQRLDKEYSDEVFNTRVMPTTPWEAVWNGIAGWWDVANTSMPVVLPNGAKFGENGLYSRYDMYHN